MSRRANAERRCPACRLHASLCVCDLLPRVETRTRLLLVIHRDEVRKPTNTGLLASRCLPNSEVHLRGEAGAPPTPLDWDPRTRPLFLFPHPDARPLTEHVGGDQPVSLIVPDGTWRQAGKVRARTAGLSAVPCVSLPEAPSTMPRLRAETRAHGMATMEAIARALGILEGDAVREPLLRIMRIMVERTLWLRGALRTDELTSPLPEAAQRVDPRGTR